MTMQKKKRPHSLMKCRSQFLKICFTTNVHFCYLKLNTCADVVNKWILVTSHVVRMARKQLNVLSGNPYWRGRLNTVDLLVLTSLDQLIFIWKILFIFSTKLATLVRRLTALSLPFQQGFLYVIYTTRPGDIGT